MSGIETNKVWPGEDGVPEVVGQRLRPANRFDGWTDDWSLTVSLSDGVVVGRQAFNADIDRVAEELAQKAKAWNDDYLALMGRRSAVGHIRSYPSSVSVTS